MSDRSDVIYIYDGTFNGFLSCVFESFLFKELPFGIFSEIDEPITLLSKKYIDTDSIKAERVKKGIIEKVSPDAFELLSLSFLTELKEKEMYMLDFVYFSMKKGRAARDCITEPSVHILDKAVRGLLNESHNYKGFVRFELINGYYISKIEPKNFVLPLLQPHFVNRFYGENFVIIDLVHHAALAHENERTEIFSFSEIDLPKTDKDEEAIKALWKCFYKTIGIKERYNPKCRQNHMPKRFWSNLTEFEDDRLCSNSNELIEKSE